MHKMFGRVELWLQRSTGKPKAYFLYRCFPTHVRENWRNISGWYGRAFGRSFTLAVWW